MISPTRFKLAIRVYPEPQSDDPSQAERARYWRRPHWMLVFDTERAPTRPKRSLSAATAISSTAFASKKACSTPTICRAPIAQCSKRTSKRTRPRPIGAAACPSFGCFRAASFLKILHGRVSRHAASSSASICPLICRASPVEFGNARDRFAGGFSLALWDYADATASGRINKYRPRIAIKHIDSKRALKGFTGALRPRSGRSDPRRLDDRRTRSIVRFRGHFLDLRTLAFVLTDRGHSCASACKAFGVERGKMHRRTSWRRDAVVYRLQPARRGSDGGAGVQAARRVRPLRRGPARDAGLFAGVAGQGAPAQDGHRAGPGAAAEFPKRYLGYAESAFFGGRTSAHIRKVPVPVVYTDFLSMYPTVNALMGLWRYVIAEEVAVVPGYVAETIDFLRTITPETLFDPQTWTRLPAFARVIPDGDVLPTRAKYSLESNDYQVGLNHLYASSDDPKDGLWFALPDLAASVLLTGRMPTIVDAFAIVPEGTAIRVCGRSRCAAPCRSIRVQDFFRTVIEERKRLASNTALSAEERKRLDKALKVLANATSYGIFAEMLREEALEEGAGDVLRHRPQAVYMQGAQSGAPASIASRRWRR